MRISDWSSDVCSSDLSSDRLLSNALWRAYRRLAFGTGRRRDHSSARSWSACANDAGSGEADRSADYRLGCSASPRSEEHTSELQSLMRISYAVFCLKKKNNTTTSNTQYTTLTTQPNDKQH